MRAEEQEYAGADAMEWWPIQVVVPSVPAPDPRFTPRAPEPLSVRFPRKSTVISVDHNVYAVADPRTGPDHMRKQRCARSKRAPLTPQGLAGTVAFVVVEQGARSAAATLGAPGG